MADISKIKLANGTTLDIKDASARTQLAAAQTAIQAEETRAKAKEAELSTAISAETTRATGAEAGLEGRIESLEARGRFLSSWSCKTGVPSTYPVVPTGASYPYTYEYKSGDYYIVDNVEKDAQEKRYMPSGSSIVKQDASSAWSVGRSVETREVGVGDYYTYDGTKWVLVSNSQKTVSFQNIAGDADDNTNLKGKLDTLRNGKLDNTATVAGVGFTVTGTNPPDVAKDSLKTALDLKALAYKESASGSGSVDTIDSITMDAVTVEGNATVTHTATTYTIPDTQKADYTPAGTITINALTQTQTDIQSTGKFTPAGTIAAKENGSFTALKSATFAKDNENGLAIEGTNAASEVSITPSKAAFVQSLKAGTTAAASFTEGAFTPASIDAAKFFSAGSQASYEHTGFSGGSFTKGTAVKATTEGIVASVGVDHREDPTPGPDESETLIFTAAATDNVMDHDATFTAAVYGTDNFTANTLPSIDVAQGFSGGSKAADTFTAQNLPVVDATADAWTGYTAAQAAAQTFTGAKYSNTVTSDTALKEVAFTGTEGDVGVTGKYDKATANGGSFTGSVATKLIPTAITYDKADATAAFSDTVTPTVNEYKKTAKTVSVTVS